MNKELFIKEIQKLNINISEEILKKLKTYYELLVSWNKKMNLTAILEHDAVYLKHFYDSATTVKVIDLNKVNNILDVGSGAGFPGIVLKILYPHLKLDIIDSNNKKIIFLNEVVNKLELIDVNLIHNRAEVFADLNREKYDVVVSRAVANLNTLVEICLPLVKISGYFIALKADANQEILAVANALKILGGEIIKKEEFLLPIEESKRTIIKIIKTSPTSLKYPRQYDKIIKKPLK